MKIQELARTYAAAANLTIDQAETWANNSIETIAARLSGEACTVNKKLHQAAASVSGHPLEIGFNLWSAENLMRQGQALRAAKTMDRLAEHAKDVDSSELPMKPVLAVLLKQADALGQAHDHNGEISVLEAASTFIGDKCPAITLQIASSAELNGGIEKAVDFYNAVIDSANRYCDSEKPYLESVPDTWPWARANAERGKTRKDSAER